MHLYIAQSRCGGIGHGKVVPCWQQRVGKLPVRASRAPQAVSRLQAKASISHFQPVGRESFLCRSAAARLQSETELFLDNLEKETATSAVPASDLRNQLRQLESQVSAGQSEHKLATSRYSNPTAWSPRTLLQAEELQARIDGLYQSAFAQPLSHENGSISPEVADPSNAAVSGLDEEAFGRLGRTQPEVSSLLCFVGTNVGSEIQTQATGSTNFTSGPPWPALHCASPSLKQ